MSLSVADVEENLHEGQVGVLVGDLSQTVRVHVVRGAQVDKGVAAAATEERLKTDKLLQYIDEGDFIRRMGIGFEELVTVAMVSVAALCVMSRIRAFFVLTSASTSTPRNSQYARARDVELEPRGPSG